MHSSVTLIIIEKFVGALVGGVILAPVSVIICLPYLLAASTADKEEYWSSFWWRAKRIAAVGLALGCLIGARMAPWV
jgi:hypothetical protein